VGHLILAMGDFSESMIYKISYCIVIMLNMSNYLHYLLMTVVSMSQQQLYSVQRPKLSNIKRCNTNSHAKDIKKNQARDVAVVLNDES
jgi:hypothetical protein